MQWQLLGAGTTINLSNGLPYYHGVVQYPVPLLTAPANHGTQSMTGPLNMSGYNISNIGSLTAYSLNGVPNAALVPGTFTDIGARINATYAQCGGKCNIFVPAGSYPLSTTINLPLNAFGNYGLTLDPGAVLAYSGSGDAMLTTITANPTIANLIIQGGTLLGNPSATSGIHLKPSQHITIRNMAIVNFSGGDAILNEGANVVNIYDNNLQNNVNGVHQVSTFCNGATPTVCSTSFSSGQGYSPNANHIHDNSITNNAHWGIFEEWNGLAGATGALDNDFRDNNLELNGTGGGTFGAIFIEKSVGDVVANNYFEGSPRNVVLGFLTGGAGDFFAASSPIVRDNYFTTSPPIDGRPKAYNIELQNTTDALIEGNTEQGTGGISSTTNCFINASPSGEMRTMITRNGIFQGVGNSSGNPICVNGTAVNTLAGVGSFTLQNPNYLSQMEFQNFQVNTAVTSEAVALQFLTANGSCDLRPVASSASAAANGRASLLAGTTYLSALSAGSVTMTHPSGTAMTVDIYCALNPTGGYGTP